MTHVLLILMQGAIATTPPPLSVEEIVERMVQAENGRTTSFAGYTGMRRYTVENKTTGAHAEMTVRVLCDETGAKRFQVVDERGSGFIRGHVLRGMIDAERAASEKGQREQTAITPRNYQFRLVETAVADGRPSYVLGISPKTTNPFLVRGRIWVDAEDFAVARLEGRPAKNPSRWITGVQVAHRNQRIGGLWLPLTDESSAQARIFGLTKVRIEYFDYFVAEAQSKVGLASAARFGADRDSRSRRLP